MSTQLVVDSSAICALFFEDETTPESEQLLQRLEAGGIWVPALFLWEVANMLLM
ncbi:MAG: type II toxin-antitoxin system VapC family toxin, partial [Cyanobacteria bacterium K_DeepCast_150m_m2_101]|nr:type II toxin-antitoxin system VapC family toxin [Cyanobacteria bacterium K_DeepCast_150m_m2_101]